STAAAAGWPAWRTWASSRPPENYAGLRGTVGVVVQPGVALLRLITAPMPPRRDTHGREEGSLLRAQDAGPRRQDRRHHERRARGQAALGRLPHRPGRQ